MVAVGGGGKGDVAQFGPGCLTDQFAVTESLAFEAQLDFDEQLDRKRSAKDLE